LSGSAIRELEQQNPSRPKRMHAGWQTIIWAYNRRVDIVLLPKGTESARFFPHQAQEVKLLQNAEWQSRRAVEKASQAGASEQAAVAAAEAGQP
jgi:hypothetical protein